MPYNSRIEGILKENLFFSISNRINCICLTKKNRKEVVFNIAEEKKNEINEFCWWLDTQSVTRSDPIRWKVCWLRTLKIIDTVKIPKCYSTRCTLLEISWSSEVFDLDKLFWFDLIVNLVCFRYDPVEISCGTVDK